MINLLQQRGAEITGALLLRILIELAAVNTTDIAVILEVKCVF
ncbi:hypothetical protein [Mucilaginibacter antarcticus]|uniref:Uncharacterized protein n=1 Tax=Mucilaginibacter antarcticus TaxID=1855725 RepID=A0ABW5XU28_9SPHI